MRKVLLLAAFAVVAMTTQAQVKFGAKAGVNLSNLVETGATFSTKIGAHVGGLANISLAEKFAVQPEILFSMEGAKDVSDKLNLSYINIPVLVQYKIVKGFYAETGPEVGILVSAKDKPSSGSAVDVKEYFNSTNFAWALGAGYNLDNGIGFNARYNVGLSKIIKSAYNQDMKTYSFALAVSYTFGGEKSSKKK